MKILYAASEALPFAASGGLADVLGSLPAAIADQGEDMDCRIVMPLYRSIKPDVRNQMTFLTDITVEVGWRKQYCGIYTIQVGKVIYYLLDNPYYFMRDGMYGFYDDCERFVFFSRAVLEILPAIDWKPDFIHCNDWQTAMVPVFYQVLYRYHQEYETSASSTPSTTFSIRACMERKSLRNSWESRPIIQAYWNLMAWSIS